MFRRIDCLGVAVVLYQSRSAVRQQLRFIIIPLSYCINPAESHRSARVSVHVSTVSLHLQLEGVWQRAADPSRLMRGEIAAGLLGSSVHTHTLTHTHKRTHTTPPPTTCRMEAISKHLQDHKRCTAGVDMSSQSKLPGAGM